tara:strand:- start:417 stop:833 length:417 start_codon:yes stop_codon:yes gene_type:complete
MNYSKPIPEITLLTEPFWEGLRSKELRMQACSQCSVLRFIPKEVCPDCSSVDYVWQQVSGLGMVYSYTTIHGGVGPAFRDDLPFVTVIVELDEGPRVMSHLINCLPDAVEIGMRVSVVFERATEELTLYKFEPHDAGR